jgi:hypothetical protein
MGGMCALSALSAIWVSFWGVGAGFRVLDFGPEGCGPSSAGGGSPVDKAEGHQDGTFGKITSLRSLPRLAADGNLRPPCGTPAAVSSGPGPVTGGVVFSKLSKLLNQEDALSAPCLQHFRN